MSLESTTPGKVGTKLASGQGPLASNQLVQMSVPTNMVAPSSPVYLTIYPFQGDSTGYFNTASSDPPRLLIHCN